MASNLQSRQRGSHRRKSDWGIRAVKITRRSAIYLAAIAVAIVSMMPVIWTMSTSLKGLEGIRAIPPKLIPEQLMWKNYDYVFSGMGGAFPFFRWLRNSVLLVAANLFGEILFASIAGYGFSRFRFRLRNAMFVLMLSSAVIPGMVRMLPQYLMFAKWGWTNTYLPLTIPNWFGSVFLVFLFRQYFVTIPKSLDEAAVMDGASKWKIFTRIILPLSKPMISTAAILVYMGTWNNFWGPFIYLHNMEKYTLAVGLRYLQKTIGSLLDIPREPALSAYSLVMAAPVIIIFFLFQRQLVQGIQLSASKE